MGRKLEALSERPAAPEGCRHHWLIDSPQGPSSRGVCRLCGATKEFTNVGPPPRREGDIAALLGLPPVPDSSPMRRQTTEGSPGTQGVGEDGAI